MIARISLCLILALLPTATLADQITLTNGRTIGGVILTNDDHQVRIRTDIGIVAYDKSQTENVALGLPAVDSSSPLVDWQHALASLVKSNPVDPVEQIPATVIDTGVLKNVPYISFHAGVYEMNIYGDPDNPAGIEIGIYHGMLATETSMRHCREFIKTVVAPSNKSIIDTLKPDQDLIERAGYTYEVTPPTASDAYGGWWISIYNTKQLDAARATKEELARITQSKTSGATTRPLIHQPVVAHPAPTSTALDETSPSPWTSDELSVARPSSTSSGNGGTVYVRGYTRKDGTYVHAYTRSAPGSGGGHHR